MFRTITQDHLLTITAAQSQIHRTGCLSFRRKRNCTSCHYTDMPVHSYINIHLTATGQCMCNKNANNTLLLRAKTVWHTVPSFTGLYFAAWDLQSASYATCVLNIMWLCALMLTWWLNRHMYMFLSRWLGICLCAPMSSHSDLLWSSTQLNVWKAKLCKKNVDTGRFSRKTRTSSKTAAKRKCASCSLKQPPYQMFLHMSGWRDPPWTSTQRS